MADFEFDNRTFDSDGVDVDDEETMLIDPTDDVDIGADVGIGTTEARVPQSLQQELLQTTIDDYYNALAEQGLTPPWVETQQNLSFLATGGYA